MTHPTIPHNVKQALLQVRHAIESRNEQSYTQMLDLPENLEAVKRAEQLLPLVIEILTTDQRDYATVLLCYDIINTICETSLDIALLEHSRRLATLVGQGLETIVPFQLTPEYLLYAQARLVALAQAEGHPLDAWLQPGSPLYVAPDPDAPLIRDLEITQLVPSSPHAHWETRLSEAASVHEQVVVLILWWLDVRHTYENQSLADLLNMGAMNLIIAEDLRREQRLNPTPCRELRQALQDARKALHGLRVPPLQRPTTIRKENRGAVLEGSRTVLLNVYQREKGFVAPNERVVQNYLWTMFHRLDVMIEERQDPEDHEIVQGFLLLYTLHALTTIYRAPGMRLSTTVEMATHLSGLDPLWGWKIQQEHVLWLNLQHAFVMIGRILSIAAMNNDRLNDQPLTYALAQLGGHLFALCRQMNLQLPQAHRLQALFWANHPQYDRASIISDQEFDRIEALLQDFETRMRQLPPEEEPEMPEEPEEVTPEAPEDTLPLDTTPAHVQKARELLAGRSIVLLAGIRKPHQHEALERALGVKVDWIEADEYAHGTHAASRLRDDTAAVLLGIRWMAHAHTPLRDIARERGIPAALLPAGLSPSAIAYHLLDQAGHQLEAHHENAQTALVG
ncbi:hypothetical protein ACINK0_15920 [Deinococcus sp. VB343]|uniref:hypothetical protein n=1 Tax=Deinococcus sp. VB343 TaxID=3385567 RepID=UPI0039C9C68F